MASTLLDGTNEVLKKVKMIQGDSGVLTTLTDSARQLSIDSAVQAWNEAIDALYELTTDSKPNIMSSATITLVTSQRAYSLASDLTRLHWPLLDSTNGYYIYEYEGGYLDLIEDQPIPADYTSLPQYAVIRPSDGKLYIDTSPSSDYNGLVYSYNYDKDASLSLAADTMPFNDTVFRSMVPVVAELWNRNQNRRFDVGIYQSSLARAASYLNQTPFRSSWLSRSEPENNTDPLNG